MNNLIQRDSRFFDDFFNELAPSFFVRPLSTNTLPDASKIKIEVQDKQEFYSIQAELPGVTKEQIDICVDGDTVTIKAEVKSQNEQEKSANVLRSERYYGLMERSFRLPVSIDSKKAQASYENGVLELNLPKLKANESTRLTIN